MGSLRGHPVSEWLIPVISDAPIVPLTYCDWAITWVNARLWPILYAFMLRIVHLAL